MATGILVTGGSIGVRAVTISGATEAAVVVGPGARAEVDASTFRDNPGIGLRVQRGGTLVLRRSMVIRNGIGRPARAGVVVDEGAAATFEANGIADNGGAAVAGLDASAAESLVRDNVVRPLPRQPARRPAAPPTPRTPTPGAPR